MANHKSAEKRARQTVKRTAVNRKRRSKMRNAVKQVELAITSGDAGAAKTALKAAQPALARAAGLGIVPKNTASRKLSRLSARVKKLSVPA